MGFSNKILFFSFSFTTRVIKLLRTHSGANTARSGAVQVYNFADSHDNSSNVRIFLDNKKTHMK